MSQKNARKNRKDNAVKNYLGVTAKINGNYTNAKEFIWDGCHKIWLIESPEGKKSMMENGWEESDIYPISKLKKAYNESCILRFIGIAGRCGKNYVEQFEPANIELL